MHTHALAHTYTHIFIVLFYKSSYKSLVINRPQTAVPLLLPLSLSAQTQTRCIGNGMAKRAPKRQAALFFIFPSFSFFSPPSLISEKVHLCSNAQTPDSEEIKFKLKFRRNKLHNKYRLLSTAKQPGVWDRGETSILLKAKCSAPAVWIRPSLSQICLCARLHIYQAYVCIPLSSSELNRLFVMGIPLPRYD